MKISFDWIKDYVDIPADFDVNKLFYDLTMSTVEVEGIADLRKQFDKIIVGKIEEVLPHPNADRLKICRTVISDSETVDIVCGGTNVQAGMNVAVACPGAMVRWHGEGDKVEIKVSKVRGVKSIGMICGASEIGLSDLFPAKEETHIVDLSDFDILPGTPIADALDLNDYILEIDNKSMTNRPDLWGHYGMAREIAALYDFKLKDIEPVSIEGAEEFPVEIQDTVRCPRYIGVKMDNVSVKPSPFKMQSRIWRVGMRPINALVDITNYVMLATGQPTHAFDSDNISDRIIVRRAEPKEHLLLLNDRELELSSEDLVIADSEGAVALAGVMGGSKDSILPDTKRVILEVANFDSKGVRQTALRYENRTEASARYEKAIDAERCDLALSMAMSFFKEIYPEMAVCAYSDVYPKKQECCEIDVDVDWLDRRLGQHIDESVINTKLSQLGFKVTFNDGKMHVVVPSWRSTGDISIKDDIMEEIARLYGYEKFEPTPITTSFTGAINQIDIDLVRRIKEYLAFRCGMQEVFTYPWMNDTYVEAILPTTDGILKLSTPPAPNEKYIRSSLLPNICATVAKNERYYNEFAIFEEAQIVKDTDYTSDYDPTEKLPLTERYIAGSMVSTSDVFMLFRKVKGIVEYMPRITHMESFTFKKAEKPFWADNVAWLNILVGDQIVGNLGVLSKKASLKCGIKKLSVVLFEINTGLLKPFTSRTNTFAPIPEYPFVDYDLSPLFDVDVKWDEIYDVVMTEAEKNPLIHSVVYIDEYKGKQLPDGKKSVSFRLAIGSDERTLTSGEIEKCAMSVVKRLKEKFNIELRGYSLDN